MDKRRLFFTLVLVSGIAGAIAEVLFRTLLDTPAYVDWCIAGSVGYMAAELTELIILRSRKAEPNAEPNR